MSDPEDTPLTAQHWDGVYRSKQVDEVSWFQADPVMSTRLLTEVVPRPSSVVDVGAGASRLVDALVDAGVAEVTVLDVSEEALAVVRDRLGDHPTQVEFVATDVLRWEPGRQWDAWHDRAVFHFLVDPDDRARYVAAATHAVAPGGVAVIGGFALDGPQQCSGLPTSRYDAEGIAEQFDGAFSLERAERELHRTPSGVDQAFTWVVLRRHFLE